LAASISVEAVTPPTGGIGLAKNHFQTRGEPNGSQFFDVLMGGLIPFLDCKIALNSKNSYGMLFYCNNIVLMLFYPLDQDTLFLKK